MDKVKSNNLTKDKCETKYKRVSKKSFEKINSEHEFDQEKKVDIWNNLKKEKHGNLKKKMDKKITWNTDKEKNRVLSLTT